nr:MAG TPA: hypothetical protein [Caudoviricetes sp.]
MLQFICDYFDKYPQIVVKRAIIHDTTYSLKT